MNPNDRAAVNSAMRITVWTACAVLFLKTIAYIYSGSAAILSDMAESMAHIFAVLFSAYSLYISQKPPDANHHYGFAKISFFSSGFEGGMIIVAGLITLGLSLYKWATHNVVTDIESGSVLVTAAVIIQGLLGFYLIRVGKRRRSLIVESNGKHTLVDCYTSVAALVGLMLYSFTGVYWIDPLCGILLSFYILFSGGDLLRRSFDGLMDKADPAITRQLTEILSQRCAHYGIRFHALRHRNDSDRHNVDLHLLFPPSTPVGEAERIASEIEITLIGALSNRAHILTHLESMEDDGKIPTKSDR